MTTPHVLIRRRRPTDIAPLAELLFAQQASSRYPFRDPLPFPVERFLHADDAQSAWTAELDGQIVGHVCRLGPPSGSADADTMNAACATAHGCPVEQLAWVSTLFVGLGTRGCGIGRRLLETALDDIHAAGKAACLEVLLTHESAFGLYESTGWREVTRLRPHWLLDAPDDSAPEVVVMVLLGDAA